ncbi:MAG: hypothetical protein ACOX2G_13260 [Bacillota bacterium]
MTRKWSESPSFFLRQPWTGRTDLLTERAAELAKEWLRRKKGPVVAGSEAINTALCAIEELKKVNQFLRVAVVVPSRPLVHQWSERIQEFFGFPERVVGLVDGERSDFYSKWTRILVCTATPGINLLAEKCDSFIGQDLLLIGHDLNHSQLHALLAAPHAYSLILLEDDAAVTAHDYYGCEDEDSEPVEPLNEESARARTTATRLLDCTNLQDSDAYFSAMLTKDMLIGDIEISEEELDHLANLITAELKKPFPHIKSSLSIAVFLVWAGILYYQEGNYWAPIYEKLGLPLSSSKWQAILGNVFLDVIRNNGLLEIRDGQTYVTPILAHGYVPDYYMESFFNDFLWPTYLKRIDSGLSISQPEVEHQVSIWRRDFREFEDLHERLAKLAEEERTLSIKLDALRNKEKVRRYEVLARRVQESELLDKVLSFPAKWLDWVREMETGQQFAIAEKAREFKESAERLAGELNSIKLQIEETGKVLFSNWTFSQCENVAALSVADIQKMIAQYQNGLSRFSGPLGWILRVLMAKRYKSVHKLRNKIVDAWQPLTLWEEFEDLTVVGTKLINSLVRLQELIAEWKELRSELAESHLPQLEAGATLDALNEEEHVRSRVADMDREMENFIALLIDLGQGNIEAGCKLAEAQREVRAEIKELRESVPIDINTLLACLPEAEKYTEEEINDLLLLVRKDKRACTEKLELYQNAYFLNESTRAFIFQGKEKATTFVHATFQYLHSLESGISQPQSTIMLPARIAQAMQKWWTEMDRSSTEGSGWAGWEKGKQKEGRIRKPTVCFDAEKRIVKVCLPSALVLFESDDEVDRAKFEAWGEASLIFQEQLPLFREAGKTYRTGALEKNLKAPQPVYKFKFSCGAIEREWNFSGPGLFNKSIMFNADGVLVENTTEYNIFPGDYAWVIAPAGSVVEPSVAERERDALIDDWSGYEAIYVDLSNIDVLIIRSGDVIDVYRRQARIEPAFIGGEGIPGVTGQYGAPVYASGLPELVFSVKDPDELALYGIKIEVDSKGFYWPAKELQPLLSRDNAVLIELGKIFANYYGEFTVVLARRNKKIWECKCVVLPDLKIAWQRPVYYLADETAPMSKLTISSVLPFIFTGQVGAVRNYSRSQTILFDTSQSVVSGTVVFALGENTYARASLVIDIPCIRWRWANEKMWRFKADEVWYRDVGEIAVKVPKGWNSVSLSLKESRQKITKPVKNGIAVFDLSKFADSLRLGKQNLQELIIESDGLAPSVLMRIRTKWLVDKVEFEVREEAGQRIVNIRWTELGKAENRVIRLWPLNNRGSHDVLTYPVPDGYFYCEIREPADILRPGKYIMQFAEEDSWSSAPARFPERGARNCIDVQIGELIEPTAIQWRLPWERKWKEAPGLILRENLDLIELRLPAGISGDDVRIVGGGCRVLLEYIDGQIYEANMKTFKKAMADQELDPYIIQVEVSGRHHEFLTVYPKWEVYDVESNIFRDGQKWEFQVSWREICNTRGRIIRIWSEDLKVYKEWPIPDGKDTKVIIREPIQGFFAGKYIIQFDILRKSNNLPQKPCSDDIIDGYLDVPYTIGQTSQLIQEGKKIINKFHSCLEYKCPRHKHILPSGIRKCFACDYQLSPGINTKSFWLIYKEETE